MKCCINRPKMSKVQTVRGFINQRLSAAAEEIFELFERTIAEYEEQLCRSKEENERQKKLLEAVYNPEVRLHRADVQQLLVSPENVPGQKKDRGLSLDQEDPPEPPHVKEEEEELRSLQETEQLHGLKEEETTEFLLTPVPAQTEEEEEPQSSQLHENQTEEMFDSESETDDSSFYQKEMRNNEKSFSCSVCGKCYKKKSNLFRHHKTHRGDDGRTSGLNQLQKEKACVSDVKCDAGKNLESSSECASRSDQNKPDHDAAKIQNNEKPFSCSVCGKSFRMKSSLFIHLKFHKGDSGCLSGLHRLQKEAAAVGDVRFDSQNNLESSEQKEEPQNLKEHKPFSCSVCDKGFSTRGNLNQHMDCHSNQRPHVCSVCGKIFPQKRYLKQHMVYHSGERPYSCSQCGKTFLKPYVLKIHQTIHTGEKPYSCNVCGRRFLQKRYVKLHMINHTAEKLFSCSQCGKRYFKSSQLKKHVTVHTGEKPYR